MTAEELNKLKNAAVRAAVASSEASDRLNNAKKDDDFCFRAMNHIQRAYEAALAEQREDTKP